METTGANPAFTESGDVTSHKSSHGKASSSSQSRASVCQPSWSSGRREMGGLGRHCPGWDVQLRALRAKASLWRVNSQRLEKLLGKKSCLSVVGEETAPSVLGCRTLTPGRALLQTPVSPLCPTLLARAQLHGMEILNQPPEETAADTFSEFISGVVGGLCMWRQRN